MVETLVSQQTALRTTEQGLKGRYYQGPDLLGEPILIRIDPRIDFRERKDFPVDVEPFSVRWTGTLRAPVSGTYTFRTRHDDGVRLWVNNIGLINDWERAGIREKTGQIQLEAGRDYPVVLDYFQFNYDAVMQLSWQYPGIEMQIIPQNTFSSQESNLSLWGGGLKAEYYNCPNSGTTVPAREDIFKPELLVYKGIDSKIHFPAWDDSFPTRTDVPTNVNVDYFAVRWTGKVRAPVTGAYKFRASVDDSIRVWVNNDKEPVLDGWVYGCGDTISRPPAMTKTIQLTEGQWYPIRVEYYQTWGYRYVTLGWGLLLPNTTAPKRWQIIPQDCLSPEP